MADENKPEMCFRCGTAPVRADGSLYCLPCFERIVREAFLGEPPEE